MGAGSKPGEHKSILEAKMAAVVGVVMVVVGGCGCDGVGKNISVHGQKVVVWC